MTTGPVCYYSLNPRGTSTLAGNRMNGAGNVTAAFTEPRLFPVDVAGVTYCLLLTWEMYDACCFWGDSVMTDSLPHTHLLLDETCFCSCYKALVVEVEFILWKMLTHLKLSTGKCKLKMNRLKPTRTNYLCLIQSGLNKWQMYHAMDLKGNSGILDKRYRVA